MRLGNAPLAPVDGSLGMTRLFELAADSPHVVYRSARGLRRTLMDCSQPPPPLPAAVTVNPPVLGPQADSSPVHLVVGLVDRSAAGIDPATLAVTANGLGPLPLAAPPRPAGDRDEDGAPELRLLLRRNDIPTPDACNALVLEVTGLLDSGEPFSGRVDVRFTCQRRVLR